MSDASPLLVGDIGGTNVRLALAHPSPAGGVTLDAVSKTPGDAYDDFADALDAYLSTAPARPDRAVFAFAAPIEGRIARLTNRDWVVDADALEARFGLSDVRLANDFAAMARSAPELGPDSFKLIKPGDAVTDAPILVAGPGTGFGMASLVPEPEGGWRVLSGEGGHQAFAPQSELEWALAERLQAKFGFVTVEHVTGGAFMDDVHEALCAVLGEPYERATPDAVLAAAANGDGVAHHLCRVRAETTLTAAADSALTVGARGGIVIAGGVAQHLADYLTSADALARLNNRGVRSDYIAAAPVRLLVDDDAPLIGAARL